jgi:hypothetical protein
MNKITLLLAAAMTLAGGECCAQYEPADSDPIVPEVLALQREVTDNLKRRQQLVTDLIKIIKDESINRDSRRKAVMLLAKTEAPEALEWLADHVDLHIEVRLEEGAKDLAWSRPCSASLFHLKSWNVAKAVMTAMDKKRSGVEMSTYARLLGACLGFKTARLYINDVVAECEAQKSKDDFYRNVKYIQNYYSGKFKENWLLLNDQRQ